MFRLIALLALFVMSANLSATSRNVLFICVDDLSD